MHFRCSAADWAKSYFDCGDDGLIPTTVFGSTERVAGALEMPTPWSPHFPLRCPATSNEPEATAIPCELHTDAPSTSRVAARLCFRANTAWRSHRSADQRLCIDICP